MPHDVVVASMRRNKSRLNWCLFMRVVRRRMITKYFRKNFATAITLGLALAAASCDRMITPRSAQIIKDAESKTADGNFSRAIALYESALDGSPRAAGGRGRGARRGGGERRGPRH